MEHSCELAGLLLHKGEGEQVALDNLMPYPDSSKEILRFYTPLAPALRSLPTSPRAT
jgi:hypothetical protein